jgi:hypothetical protein
MGNFFSEPVYKGLPGNHKEVESKTVHGRKKINLENWKEPQKGGQKKHNKNGDASKSVPKKR